MIAGRKHRLIEKGVNMPALDIAEVSRQSALRQGANKRLADAKKKAREERSAPSLVLLTNPEPLPSKVGRIPPTKSGVFPMTEGAKTIVQLKTGECKAAVGEPPAPYMGHIHPQLFCAAPTGDAEKKYCDNHAHYLYRTVPRRMPGGRGLILERLGTLR